MNPNPAQRVLIADDEESLRFVLRELLAREGFEVDEAADGAEAVERAQSYSYELYLLDMKMPRMDGLTALREIRRLHPDALAVMITAFGSQVMAIEALKAGAYDYFTKPFNIEELRIILTRAMEKQNLMRRVVQLERQLSDPQRFGTMVGGCDVMRLVFEMIRRVAVHDVTVLITGESGTGKELVARAIHEHSPRAGGPFVAVNCAAIPEPLLESELFGHERGAFTGAVSARPGQFEAASGGTIFLDEIGEMPLALQAKLLRTLQERQVQRVGANTPRPIDIRVLTATNRDLGEMVRSGAFREDLYFRVNVVQLRLPPLRERLGDLPALVQYFIGEFNSRFGKRIEGLTPEAMTLMESYRWPGNIRELENTLQRAMVMAMGQIIDAAALPGELRGEDGAGEPCAMALRAPGGTSSTAHASQDAETDLSRPLADQVERVVEREEKRLIQAALARMNSRRQETADLLGISRKSLHNKMLKYDLFEKGRGAGEE